MNLQMLESFNECTLKQMIIDLHAENKKLKDEENKALEAVKQEKEKEIFDLKWKIEDLLIRLKISNDRCQKYYQESRSSPKSQILQWTEQNCEECDNITDKKGILRAPTDYETLYNDYVVWCYEEQLENRADKKTFKTQILDWQKNSKYGLSIGKTKEESHNMPNGYLRSPFINLKIV